MEEVKSWSTIIKELPWDELVRSIPVLIGVALGGWISPWVAQRLAQKKRKSELKHELKKNLSLFFNHKKNHLISSNSVSYYSKYSKLLVDEHDKETISETEKKSIDYVFNEINSKYKDAAVEYKEFSTELEQDESELYGILSEIIEAYPKDKSLKIEQIVENEIDIVNKSVGLYDYSTYNIDSLSDHAVTLERKLSEECLKVHDHQKTIFSKINSIL